MAETARSGFAGERTAPVAGAAGSSGGANPSGGGRAGPERTILHCDMNAFFASVEQEANPALRGRPLAVGGGGPRSVVCTASYEARAWGVKTGMTAGQARRQCPDLIFVPPDFEKYTDTCRRLVEIYREVTPCVECFSVDEAFLDATALVAAGHVPEALARRIKERIRGEVGLRCSIGIAPNKILAKLASDLQKPDGLVRVRPEDVPRIVWPLPVNALCGIGPRLAVAFRRMGVETLGQLAAFPVGLLRERFGIYGEYLHEWSAGRDRAPVIPSEEAGPPVSIGHSVTLERDVGERERQVQVLLRLSEMVGRRARAAGLAGRTLAVTFRYPDFETFSRHRSFGDPVDDSSLIFEVARSVLAATPLRAPVRLLGIRLSKLEPAGRQATLFPEAVRRRALVQAMDRVNDRYGEFSLRWGAAGTEGVWG